MPRACAQKMGRVWICAGWKVWGWVVVLRARVLWEKLPKLFRQALGGISVVPKVPYNLKTIRRQVRGFFITWQWVVVPGLREPVLCCYRLQLGVRRGGCCCQLVQSQAAHHLLSHKYKGLQHQANHANATIHHAKLSRHWRKLTGSVAPKGLRWHHSEISASRDACDIDNIRRQT